MNFPMNFFQKDQIVSLSHYLLMLTLACWLMLGLGQYDTSLKSELLKGLRSFVDGNLELLIIKNDPGFNFEDRIELMKDKLSNSLGFGL